MVSKVAIFGGTGMTGQVVVEHALSKGKLVTCTFRCKYHNFHANSYL